MSDSSGSSQTPGGRNRLQAEKSPYLLQHASNPVDWYPWGAEAFARARDESKPIFLSIGYSTCHWCHVMAHESFEDPDIAALMNQAFVNIKVDREERPDLDHIYMMVCQMMTAGGGWPLSIIMTPEGKPFFAATYIPRENRFGRVGMLELIPRVAEFWRADRASAQAAADRIAELLSEAFGGPAARASDSTAASKAARAARGAVAEVAPPGRPQVGAATFEQAYGLLAANFDKQHGGFGGAPKFPASQNLLFLLRYWKRTGTPEALEMVELTLGMMRRGGLYDHLGFGFHRYSTDASWLVPHFEKMLYDQALLAIAYLEAYQATGKTEYRETVDEVLTYVERDMTSEEGAFYSAEDADTEGEEGKFYLWTIADLRSALGAEDAGLAAFHYGIEDRGGSGEEPGGASVLGVLHAPRPAREAARELGMEPAELTSRLARIRERLLAARGQRPRPRRDDKVLADWNGLMIAAYAMAAGVLDEPRYLMLAERAAEAVLARLRSGGRLMHRWRDGEAAFPGNLDDYAFMIWGLVELYEASFEVKHLSAALELAAAMVEHFGDDADGGLFFTPDDGPEVLVRPRVANDGAIPSGNSVALLDLLRLARLAGDHDMEAKASALAAGLAPAGLQSPLAHLHFLTAMDFAAGPTFEVVVVGNAGAPDTAAMLRALRSGFRPNKVVLLVEPGGDSPIGVVAPYTSGLASDGGKATAYVCRDFACQVPTTDIGEMLRLVDTRPTAHGTP